MLATILLLLLRQKWSGGKDFAKVGSDITEMDVASTKIQEHYKNGTINERRRWIAPHARH
jgi:hypothetical protein